MITWLGSTGASEHGYGLGLGGLQLPRFLLNKGALIQSASEFVRATKVLGKGSLVSFQPVSKIHSMNSVN